jgi:Dolichyl-phosphate-mannose-protein mannosyltransferase
MLHLTRSNPVVKRHERALWLFLAIWFAAGVLQSIFMNLDGEEAYYAIFARHLAWGYFDHPPALAFFIKLGTLIFPGYLGPRFFIVVLSTATLWVGSRLVERKQIPFVIAIVCGLGLVQAGSFVIKPDIPLLFFATLFFYFLKRYLAGSDLSCVIPLSVAIAGMLLSKYHGLLLVGLTLLSTPRLLKRPSFWLIALLSLVLTLPHAIWLFDHNFVTIRFQSGGRKYSGLEPQTVVEYVLMQPLVLGPLIGFILLPVAIIAKPRDSFERILKFDLIGIFLFFFITSFSVRVHYHWTSIALIPVLILAIPFIWERPKLRGLATNLAIVTAIAFVPIRLYLAWDFLPSSVDRKLEIVHGWPSWARDVQELAAGRNVVFLNDYANAGLYTYYTGEMADSYNAFDYRNTQQDLWPIEEAFRGKPAIVISSKPLDQFKTAQTRNGAILYYRFVEDYEPYIKVELRLADAGPLHLTIDKTCQTQIVLINHYDRPILFKDHTELTPVIAYRFTKGVNTYCHGTCDVIAGLALQNELTRTVNLWPPGAPGDFKLQFSIQPGWLPPSLNDGTVNAVVAPADH